MDNITNKALVIAVGIFVTIAITSGILTSINEMKNIYEKVYETDTSITSRFSEFDKYDGTIMTGIDLVNTVRKYNATDDNYPDVTVVDEENEEISISRVYDEDNNRPKDDLSSKYNVSVMYNDDDTIVIKFSE